MGISRAATALLPLLLLGAGVLSAEPVTYTFTGSGTGTLGSTTFTDASFVATLTSDTADVGFVPSLSSLGVLGLPADIDITGIGLLNFTGTTFIYTFGDSVGFGEGDPAITDGPGNLIQITDPSVSGYGLASDLTASGTNVLLSQFHDADTSGGLLTFRSMSSVTFQSEVAGATPEPGTLALSSGLFGLLGIAWMRRKRALLT